MNEFFTLTSLKMPSFSWDLYFFHKEYHTGGIAASCLLSGISADYPELLPIPHFSGRAQQLFSSAIVYLGSKPSMKRKGRCNVAECIKVRSDWEAGDHAANFSDSTVRLCFKDEVCDAFLPPLLLVRSSTALELNSL